MAFLRRLRPSPSALQAKRVITHSAPAWREQTNYILVVDLTSHNHPGRAEQVWVRNIEDDLFQICCIPFFLYGVALGDVVRASTATKPTQITEVVRRSGHSVIRVAAINPHFHDVHDRVHGLVERLQLANEWMVEGYAALDTKTDAEHELVLAEVDDLQAKGWAFVEDATSRGLGIQTWESADDAGTRVHDI